MTIDFDQNTLTLARWANSLYAGVWPPDMPGLPDNPDALPFDHPDVIRPIVNEIRQRIGIKEILRYHHLHNLKKSNEDFNAWWSEKGEALINTKVALSVHFDAKGLPVARARVINKGDESEAGQ